MPFSDLAKVRLRYSLEGDESRPVLTLSNSLGTTLDMWTPQMSAFLKSFRVLRYDTRGHGRSGVPEGPYDFVQLGADVLGLLDDLGIERSHFCGLSMGGVTGMWLSIFEPQRIHRLVLCNTAAYIGPPEVWSGRIATVKASGMAAIVDGVAERWLTPEFRQRETEITEYLKGMLGSMPPAGYAASCEAIRDNDLREQVTRISAPTLVIAGTYDAATPAKDGEALAKAIPGARYEELPAAHLSNWEQPEAFTRAVLDFLGSGEVASRSD